MFLIVISGAEASGKSTLTKYLSSYFNAIGTGEYARCYVERLDRKYDINDVETIAKRQCAQFLIDNRNLGDSDIVFYDTFLIITKVWFEEVYGQCPIWLHKAIKKYKPNLVLLCYPDLVWESDGVRENGEKRYYLYKKYQSELEYYKIDYKLVSGIGEIREERAKGIVKNWINRIENE